MTASTTQARAVSKTEAVADKETKQAYSKLMTAIKAYGKQAAKMDETLHAIAVRCLRHAESYGDVRPVDALVRNLGKSQRVKGLMVWVEMFSPVRWNGDGKCGLLSQTAKNFTPFDCATAEETPFWELNAAKEHTAKPLSMEILKGLILRLEKRMDKEEGEGLIPAEELPAIHETIVKLKKAVA